MKSVPFSWPLILAQRWTRDPIRADETLVFHGNRGLQKSCFYWGCWIVNLDLPGDRPGGRAAQRRSTGRKAVPRMERDAAWSWGLELVMPEAGSRSGLLKRYELVNLHFLEPSDLISDTWNQESWLILRPTWKSSEMHWQMLVYCLRTSAVRLQGECLLW